MSPKPFPPSVVESLLVKCHRHCCICHKPCGSKMIIHHIDPDGGNNEDNGIPLCFDCHSDVRAYDSSHPIGRKYTYSELKKHKDQWFALCSIPPFTPRQYFKPSMETPFFDSNIFDSLVVDDQEPASKLVAQYIQKPEVRIEFLKEVFNQLKSEDDETRWKMAHIVEQTILWDPSLIPSEILEEMASDDFFSVRSSAAMCYNYLAMANPANIPIQTILRLSNDSDWYVYTPAIQCLKKLAKSRPLVLDIFFETLDSDDPLDREIGAYAILDISKVEPWLLKYYMKKIKAHLEDTNKNVVECLKKALENLNKTPTEYDYPPI